MGFGPVQWKKAGWVRRSALGRQRSRLGLALASLGQREPTCSLLLLDAAGGDGDGSRGSRTWRRRKEVRRGGDAAGGGRRGRRRQGHEETNQRTGRPEELLRELDVAGARTQGSEGRSAAPLPWSLARGRGPRLARSMGVGDCE